MKKDDYVKIVAIDGNYRYGYIEKIEERGFILIISMFDEGISKIAYDAAADAIVGQDPTDYISLLTEVEKRIVPLLSAGYNTNKIAAAMSISPTTVRSHLRTMRIKLHLDDRAQLIAISLALDSMLTKQVEVDKETTN
ncbi:MAG: LuxR family transcriptional regulator [Dehalococcoidia bacterium]|nr:MAG: LuxR family transcriptional regulator [Dehalococcoidia bacterium]